MTSLRNCLLLTFLSTVLAFTPTIPSTQTHRTLSSPPLFGLAPPETITITKTKTKSKSKEKQTQKQDFQVFEGDMDTDIEEAPLWNLFLIGDETYSQNHVTQRMEAILPDVNSDGAGVIYEAAQRIGEALCGKYEQEMAEFYAEQLTRSDPIIYAEAREDKKKDD
jgi:ATP-dependent Clp protease adapter protein ClpS